MSLKDSVPRMNLLENEKPFFKKILRENDVTSQIHAYVTLGNDCENNCKFCRNKSFSKDSLKKNDSNLMNSLKEIFPYAYTIVWGGGEPLLYAEELYKILCNHSNFNVNSYIITSGIRSHFLREFMGCKLCQKLEGIMISRYHYADDQNRYIFGNENLISKFDIKFEFCNALKDKMEFAITCIKGVIDSKYEILKFLEWGNSIGIKRFLFNNLQKEVTEKCFYSNYQINKNVFSEAQNELVKLGFKPHLEVCYTGGFDIATYKSHDGIMIGFKTYHEEKIYTKEKWNATNRHTYNLAIMPNGRILLDKI